MSPPALTINPPLLNSANPWATTPEDLHSLYSTPSTGAITIRTSLLTGFPHDASIHQYTFFQATTGTSKSSVSVHGQGEVLSTETSSLNTLGYSPHDLTYYLTVLSRAAEGKIEGWILKKEKPVIVSVTGSADEVAECYKLICEVAGRYEGNLSLWMEINLSCPNIIDKPPPAYDGESLKAYLASVAKVKNAKVPVGIKTPPYTYHGQYVTLIDALKTSIAAGSGVCPVDFITACNTLGSCLVINEGTGKAALNSANGEGIGGMAGPSLHPLALGNVASIRKMLDSDPVLSKLIIVGIGGVSDAAGFERMKSVGADIVGVGTALGREGVGVFDKILNA